MRILKTKLLTIFCTLFIGFQLYAQTAATYDDHGLIIQFTAGTTISQINSALGELNSTLKWHHPTTNTVYAVVNSFPYIYPPTGQEVTDINNQFELAQDRGDVDDTGYDYLVKVPTITPVGNLSPCYDLEVNPNPTNAQLKVCILDTGLSPLFTDFTPSSGYNYVDGNTIITDDNGHGTHLASVAAEAFEDNSSYLANQIHWDIRKTHDANGEGQVSDIIRAIYDVTNQGVSIINMSFSYYQLAGEPGNEVFKEAIEYAETNNVLIITAAGNDHINNDRPNNTVAFPCSFRTYNIIGVGAYRCNNERLTPFSNWGKYSVDIAAPGERLAGMHWLTGGNLNLSGTSQSAALTTGVAAALGVHQSFFNYQEVKCAILSGVDVKSTLDNRVYTSGLINADQAMDELLAGCTDIIEPNYGARGSEIRTSTASNYKLYPNPVLERLTILAEDGNSIEEVYIYDIHGRQIYSYDNVSEGINTSSWSPGIYIVKPKINHIIYTERIVKN